MFPILLVLLVGTLAYLWWLRTRTTLTRSCRWREYPADDLWRCAFCGAEIARGSVTDAPRVCLREDR